MNTTVNLDSLGQQPGLNIYTQLCLCFPVDDDSRHESIKKVLQDGLATLASNYPWTAGQIIRGHGSCGAPGVFRIVPWMSAPLLVVRDLRTDPSVPSFGAMYKARFPFGMLGEETFAPYKTIPGGIAGSGAEPTAVFAVQANFVRAGLVLVFVGHHQVMDMTGIFQLMSLLSKSCRYEAWSPLELSFGAIDRSLLVQLLEGGDEAKLMSHIPQQVTKLDEARNTEDVVPASAEWAYFSFTRQSLAGLKDTALATASRGFVSTDDALTALLWKAIAYARLGRLGQDVKVTLGRAVDARRYLGVPNEYPGLLNNMVYHKRELQHLVQEPLGRVAAELRQAVDPSTSDIGVKTRALATLLHVVPDNAAISLTATIDPPVDLMVSSWAKPDCYHLDFGLGLGKPTAARRPRFVPVEGLVYFMPRSRDGEIVVAICLRKEDMENLTKSQDFAKHGVYIG